MAKKKKKSKLKKILKTLGKVALAGGAAYGASKLFGGRKGNVSTVGQPTGTGRVAHRPANLGDFNQRTDAYKPEVIRTSADTRGRDPTWWENIAHGGRTQPNKNWFKKGGRVTGAAKRGFGRALMKGKK